MVRVMKGAASAYVPALTGLRAIAAGVVVLFHYFEASLAVHGANLPWLTWLLGNGQNGVTLFFVLSGFLIVVRYRDALRDKRIGFGRYLSRRYARIYPAYFVACFGLCVLPQMIFDGSDKYQAALTWLGLAVMAQAIFMDLFALGVPVGWSLTLEEIFYLLSPRVSRWLSGGLVSVIGGGLAVLALCAALFYAIVQTPQLYAWSGADLKMLYQFSFVVRAPEFLAGCVAGLLLLDHGHRIGAQGARWCIVIGLLIGLPALLATNHFFLAGRYAIHAALRVCAAIGLCVLMLGLARDGGRGWLSRQLGSPLMDYLGKTSYSLYLVHLTWPLQKLWFWMTQLPVNPVMLTPVVYFFTLLASFLLYEAVERPAHDAVRRRTEPAR